MIKLFQFPALWNLPNASPFCMKLETYLRLAHLPYEIVVMHDPRSAPKGKLPYIEDKGVKIADSGLIIDYLKHTYGDPLDAHLTAIQNGQALALQRLVEEHLYWAVVYSRWVDPQGWAIVKPTYFGHLPFLVRCFVPDRLRKYMQKELHYHGLGLHAAADVYKLGNADITALSDILNDQSYFMGDQVTSIDACIYAMLANILKTPIHSPLQAHARTCANLLSYCERMATLLEKSS
jgi:glutathione S-transferase